MSSKQPLLTATLDTEGHLVLLQLSPQFEGHVPLALLSSLPDFVAEGLADFFSGTDPVLLRIRCSLSCLTPWQQQIIRTLAGIPRGKVTDYAGLAALAGHPGAARAAASACAANPLPLIFPCHRIVYANGDPGAYMRQPAHPLKKRLLEIEGIEFSSNGRIPKEYFL